MFVAQAWVQKWTCHAKKAAGDASPESTGVQLSTIPFLLQTMESPHIPMACVSQGEDQLAERLVVLHEVAATHPRLLPISVKNRW